MADEPNDRLTLVLLAATVEGGLIAVAWLLGWWLDHPPLQTFAWDGPSALEGLAATLPLVLLFLAMMRWPIGPLAGIKRISEDVIRPLLAPCTLIDLIGISVLAGLSEEMFFRGVLQAAFAGGLGRWGALAAASALFGLMHAVSPTYAVLAAVMGALLGALWIHSGNLLAPVIVHGLYDLVVLVYLLRGPGSAAMLADRSEDRVTP
jgi:membrane protease YdiL (CAAX protease family)